MFGNSKEYHDIQKLYLEKVSKTEDIQEFKSKFSKPQQPVKSPMEAGMGPGAAKARAMAKARIAAKKAASQPKPSKPEGAKVDTSSEIESSSAEFKANEGDKFNKNFIDKNRDTSSEIESSSSEFKANEGDKVNQRFKKDVQIVRNSQMTGKQRAQEMAKKRIAAKKAGTYEKPKTAQELAKERIKAKEAGTYKKPKTAQELARERIAAGKNTVTGQTKPKPGQSRFGKPQPKVTSVMDMEGYDPYDQIADLLISEGYADNMKDAQFIMSQPEFIEGFNNE